MERKLMFDMFRFNPDLDDRPYYDTYQLQEAVSMNVLEALMKIQHEQVGSWLFVIPAAARSAAPVQLSLTE